VRAFGAIGQRIAQITALVERIREGSEHQSQSLGTINVAVAGMDRTTQQNAAMVEEATAAAKSLATEARQLTDLVDRFAIANRASAYRPAAQPVRPAPYRTPFTATWRWCTPTTISARSDRFGGQIADRHAHPHAHGEQRGAADLALHQQGLHRRHVPGGAVLGNRAADPAQVFHKAAVREIERAGARDVPSGSRSWHRCVRHAVRAEWGDEPHLQDGLAQRLVFGQPGGQHGAIGSGGLGRDRAGRAEIEQHQLAAVGLPAIVGKVGSVCM
jgi:hypothetical protein